MPKDFVGPREYYAHLARVRQGAGALITSPEGRVVMYDVSYRDHLELPGGAVEADESPPAACARECHEELGVDIAVGRLLAVDHQTDGGERVYSVIYVYDGGVIEESSLTARDTGGGQREAPVIPPLALSLSPDLGTCPFVRDCPVTAPEPLVEARRQLA